MADGHPNVPIKEINVGSRQSKLLAGRLSFPLSG